MLFVSPKHEKTVEIATKTMVWISRLLLCATFIFSGFVKLADPMGMVHKLHAYTAALSMPISDSSLLLKVVATALGTLEFILGIYLLQGVKRKFTTRTIALFMLTFTVLTVWIYFENPVPDCGCFGDAIKLTNGQTLVKNVVLLAAAVFLLFHPLSQQSLISYRHAWILTIYSWGYAISLALYSLHYLPVFDFSGYVRGADIKSALMGEATEKEIDKLANFCLVDPQTQNDVTLDVLNHKGYTFILTVPTANNADDGCCDRINDLYDYCTDQQIPFYMATSSTGNDLTEWVDKTGAAYPILLAEDSELNAMVRSNPGLLLLKDGIVMGKWSNNDLPEINKNTPTVDALVANTSEHNPMTTLLLWFVGPFLFIIVVDTIWTGHKYYQQHIHVKRFKLKKT